MVFEVKVHGFPTFFKVLSRCSIILRAIEIQEKNQHTKTSNLTIHKRIHTSEKPCDCQFGKKTFKSKSELVRNGRIHIAEKTF